MEEDRVSVSDAARELIEQLKAAHGPIMFHLSGGCCDGSAPMCFEVGEFKLGGVDEKVGVIAGCEFWMDREQFKRWSHTRWMVDVVPGRGASFSLEAPLNKRFLIRSSLCAAPGVVDAARDTGKASAASEASALSGSGPAPEGT